ncbi:MAG: tRNA (adenine(22)-N(1))-methyltransferase [Burkholderiales bacterium]
MSSRLNAIVSMVPYVKTVADIGCDHGKIAVLLLEAGKAQTAVCSDISGKSLKKAERLAHSKGLEKRMSFRVGDGLSVLEKGEADAAVIAGMGGELIARILDDAGENAPKTLVLSCNTKAQVLRQWLCGNGYVIEDEEMADEGKRFYPVILAKRGRSRQLNGIELELGPVLLRKRPETLLRFLDKLIGKQKQYLDSIKKNAENASVKIKEIEERIKAYEEARDARRIG